MYVIMADYVIRQLTLDQLLLQYRYHHLTMLLSHVIAQANMFMCITLPLRFTIRRIMAQHLVLSYFHHRPALYPSAVMECF